MTMQNKSQRQLQIGENIKRILSEIFLRDDILTVPGSYITVLEADISPDAKNAKIYLDIFGNEKMHDKILAALNKNAAHFRFQLAKKLSMRFVPEIIFTLDRTEQQAASLESLISQEAQRYKQIEQSVKMALKKSRKRAAAPKKAPAKKAVAKKVAKKTAKK
jgi:ribosome-binding factor A